MESRSVRGEIVLPTSELPAKPVDVVIQVEDVSRADAPSTVISQQRQEGVSLRPGGVLPFAVEVPADLVDERRSYSLRVHIDVSGSGEVETGDLVSTESYPVLTRGHGTQSRVRVKRV
ncbi:MAG: YbaY family lipoprotein [Gammaproteobacteria bacterium]